MTVKKKFKLTLILVAINIFLILFISKWFLLLLLIMLPIYSNYSKFHKYIEIREKKSYDRSYYMVITHYYTPFKIIKYCSSKTNNYTKDIGDLTMLEKRKKYLKTRGYEII